MKNIYTSAVKAFVIQSFGLLLAFFLQVSLTRTLSTQQYGEYAIYIAYSGVLSILTIFGMDQTILKETAKDNKSINHNHDVLKFSLKIAHILVAVVAFLLIVIGFLLNIKPALFVFLICTIFIKTISSLLDGYLQGFGQIVKISKMNLIINNIVKICIYFIFVWSGIGVYLAAFLSYFTGELIVLIFKRIENTNYFEDEKSSKLNSLTKSERNRFLKYSFAIALTTSSVLIMQNIDKFVISAFMSYTDVGYYKVAQSFAVLITVFVAPFAAFWPHISRLYHEGNLQQIEIEMKRIIRIISKLAIPLFITFLFYSDVFLRIFGENYVNDTTSNVLIIIAFALLFDAIAGPIGSVVVMTNYAKYALFNNLATITIDIVLSIVLVQYLGLIGVAVAYASSIMVNNLTSILIVRIYLKIQPYDLNYLAQIILLFSTNLIFGNIVRLVLRFNDYMEVVVFMIILYAINTSLLIYVEREGIKMFINKWKEGIK